MAASAPAGDGRHRLQAACGTLEGGVDHATGVRSFRGIPYAKPPVGPLRWRPPEPAPGWTGVRDATSFGADCPQTNQNPSRAPAQSEDCLYLNVWTPPDAAPGSLPVMVWIHGGSFVGGSGADARVDGSALASRGVVVVTLNYRVGLFGFLAHEGLTAESAHGSSGNYGLLDQLCALAWVRGHIAAFGGNPERVTLFGVSAGSASISLLLTSPLAKGLFQQAILQSPGAARPLASLTDAEKAGAQVAPSLDALRRLTSAEVLARTSLLNPKVRGLTTPRVLRPIRDGWVLREDERPAFKAGRLHAMPILIGSNADEGSLLTATWPVDTVAAYRDLIASNFGETVQAALEHYPVANDAEVRGRVAELFADTQFNYGTRLLARAMTALRQPTWRYVFTRRRPGQTDGPHHGEEVAHVFGNLAAARGASPTAFDAHDEALSAQMMASWVAFAVSGNPNRSGLPQWPAHDPQSDLHLVLGSPVDIASGWRRAPLDFLERLYLRRETAHD